MLDSLEAEPETGIQCTCLIEEVLPGEREWGSRMGQGKR